ncbi:MAG: hypothetical protein EA397_16125, partial [Deltaproteobacteria bacterium]
GEPLDDELICNGEDGRAAFVDIVDIDLGNLTCPYGGLRFIYGYADDDPDDLETVDLCYDCDPLVSGATLTFPKALAPFAVQPQGLDQLFSAIRYVEVGDDWSQRGLNIMFGQLVEWRWEMSIDNMFGGEGELFFKPELLGRWLDEEEDEVLYLTCDEPLHGCLNIRVEDRAFQWSMSFRDFGPMRTWRSSIDLETESDITVDLLRIDGVDGWFYAGTTSGVEGLQLLGGSLPGADGPVDVITTLGEGQLWFDRDMCRD